MNQSGMDFVLGSFGISNVSLSINIFNHNLFIIRGKQILLTPHQKHFFMEFCISGEHFNVSMEIKRY